MMKTWTKCGNHFFQYSVYILHHNTTNFCTLVIFHTFFTLICNQLQIENEKEQNPYIYIYIWLSMRIDHSNPYMHSTTLLCDRQIVKWHIQIYIMPAIWYFNNLVMDTAAKDTDRLYPLSHSTVVLCI